MPSNYNDSLKPDPDTRITMAKVSVRLWLGIGYLLSSLGIVTYLSTTVSQEVQHQSITYSATSHEELARVANSHFLLHMGDVS